MCFYGALGYVQIASDFRIVTALKQQIDDLLLPVPHLTNVLFHSLHLNGRASGCRKWQNGNQIRRAILDSGRCMHSFVHPRDQSSPVLLPKCENL
jgi:hypothetical protein